MKMVAQQAVGMHLPARLRASLAQALQEERPILSGPQKCVPADLPGSSDDNTPRNIQCATVEPWRDRRDKLVVVNSQL
jgi:hypothetical protein